MQASEETRPLGILRLFMRFFFFLLYHPFAWIYDLVAAVVSAGRWKGWVRQVTPFLPTGAVLELGHGPGHLQAHLTGADRQVFGIDRSRQMGRIAYRRLRRTGRAPRLGRANALALPFPARAFRSVVATFPTEYIAQPETLEEVRRVLLPGGKLVVLLSAWITGGSLIDRALAKLFEITGQSRPVIETSQRSIEILAQAGFSAHFEWVDDAGSRLLIVVAEAADITT